jgi:hypothetical protein
MAESIVQMLVGVGELVLIMGASAGIMFIVWAIKQSLSNKQ